MRFLCIPEEQKVLCKLKLLWVAEKAAMPIDSCHLTEAGFFFDIVFCSLFSSTDTIWEFLWIATIPRRFEYHTETTMVVHCTEDNYSEHGRRRTTHGHNAAKNQNFHRCLGKTHHPITTTTWNCSHKDNGQGRCKWGQNTKDVRVGRRVHEQETASYPSSIRSTGTSAVPGKRRPETKARAVSCCLQKI